MITLKLVTLTFITLLTRGAPPDAYRYNPETREKTIECSGVAVCLEGAQSCEVTIWECDFPVLMRTCLETGEVWAYDAHVDAEDWGGESSAPVLGCSTTDAESGPWPASVDVDADAINALEVK